MPDQSLSQAQTSELYAKINLLISMGKFESAEKIVRSELENQTTSDLLTLLGHTQQAQGRLADAKSSFRKAIALDPGHVEAAMILAAVLCDTSQYDEAQKVFSSIEENIDKEWGIPKYTLGLIAKKHIELSRLYGEINLWTEAATEAKQSLNLAPDNVATILQYAKCLLKSDSPDLARQILEPLSSGEEPVGRARVLLGIAYIKLRQPLLAKEQWQLISSNPDVGGLDSAFRMLADEF